MNSVPVSITDLFGGLAIAHGVARYDGAHLTIEYVVEDAIFSAIKSSVREVRLPIEDLAGVSVKRWIFGTRLTIRAHRVGVLVGIPGCSGVSLVLKVKRAHRDDAQSFASSLSLAISEARLEALERDAFERRGGGTKIDGRTIRIE